MKLFLDTNVVVDAVKFREPYVRAIVPIFQMGQAESINWLFLT